MKIFWAVLLERAVQDEAVNALLDVATRTAHVKSNRLSMPYGRVDVSRNALVETFLQMSTSEDDVLVMLDNDHLHPPDVVVRLAQHASELEVVGAAYRRRGDPFDWQAFRREAPRVKILQERATPLGVLRPLSDEEITGDVVPVDALGTGAIAIRRSVFTRLSEHQPKPWFRYVYCHDSMEMPSEDIYFSALCEWAGIEMWCDTGLVTPHLTTASIERLEINVV